MSIAPCCSVAQDRSVITVAPKQSSPTAGIQEAVDAVVGNGGIVELQPGEYALRQSIRIRNNIEIRGLGEKTVLRKVKQLASKLTTAVDAGSRSISVESTEGFGPGDEIGLFDRKTVGWLHTHAVLKGVERKELLLDRRVGRAFDPQLGACVINYFPAITGTGVSNVVLRSLTLDGRSYENPGLTVVAVRDPRSPQDLGFTFAAIHLVDVVGSRIDSCHIKGWPADGISLQRGSANLVTKCVVEDCRGEGYHPGGGLYDTEFSENLAEGNIGDGFFFCAGVKRVTVRNNRFIRNKGNGIGDLGHDGDKYNVVENNLCEANGLHGIALWDGENNIVRNNTCLNNSQSVPGQYSGILLAKTENSVVANNHCFDNQKIKTQKHGIEETANCQGNAIIDNNCRSNAIPGGSLAGRNRQERGNRN